MFRFALFSGRQGDTVQVGGAKDEDADDVEPDVAEPEVTEPDVTEEEAIAPDEDELFFLGSVKTMMRTTGWS